MGEFWGIIQAHLDRYGVREAAFARKIGTVSQTTSNWKHRGLAQLPKRELLEAVARETSTPYEVVLRAVLVDIGYLTPESAGVTAPTSPLTARVPVEPHATPVTEQDIAAGASLPLAEPRHQRSARSSDTRPRRHTI